MPGRRHNKIQRVPVSSLLCPPASYVGTKRHMLPGSWQKFSLNSLHAVLSYNTLLAAQAEAEAMHARRPLWSILFSLSQLETDLSAAQQLRWQSQQIVTSTAEHTPAPELRASFLPLPDVAAVFEPIPG